MTGIHWTDFENADYVVVGDPVGHSLSPVIHEAAYAALGLSLKYEKVLVPKNEFEPAMAHLKESGVKGANVTLPHKSVAARWAGEHRPYASFNTLDLVSGKGTNTDVPGFMKVLADAGFGPCKCLVLGAGGAAVPIARELARQGFGLHVWNRTPGKWEAILSEISLVGSVLARPDASECGLVVNATSAEKHGEPLSVVWPRERAFAFDLNYTHGKETAFVIEARSAGLQAVDGLPMLVEQAALSFEWWVRHQAPRTEMLKAVGL